MRMMLPALALLAGCASPEYVASRGDFDVCRLTMGGPHAQAADQEARRRGLNCHAYYPAIQSRQAQDDAAIQQFLRSGQPALTCRTIPWGIGTRTVCQ